MLSCFTKASCSCHNAILLAKILPQLLVLLVSVS